MLGFRDIFCRIFTTLVGISLCCRCYCLERRLFFVPPFYCCAAKAFQADASKSEFCVCFVFRLFFRAHSDAIPTPIAFVIHFSPSLDSTEATRLVFRIFFPSCEPKYFFQNTFVLPLDVQHHFSDFHALFCDLFSSSRRLIVRELWWQLL